MASIEQASTFRDGERGQHVASVQAALVAAGFGPLDTDGVWGPKSRAAYERWRAGRPATSAAPVEIIETPRALVLGCFRSWEAMRVTESSFNRGRWVTAIATYGGRDPSSDGAWCAWGVSAALLIATHASGQGVQLVTRTDGSVRSLWQKNADRRVPIADVRAGRYKPVPCDVYVRARKASDVGAFEAGSPLGHTGIIDSDVPTGWRTIDANTDGDGSAEGDGVRYNTVRLDDDRLVGIIRPAWRVVA